MTTAKRKIAPEKVKHGAGVRSIEKAGFQKWSAALVKSNAGARIKLVRTGVNADILVSASEYFAMPRAQFVKILGMSSATAERKINAGQLLGQAESERLERLALIEDLAEKVFGAASLAREWLTRKN